MTQYRTIKEHWQHQTLIPAGTLIAVGDDMADWMAKQGVITKAGVVATPIMAPPATTLRTWPGGCCGGR